MQNTPRAVLMQFAQLFQGELFPALEQTTGELSGPAKLLAEALTLTQLHRFVHKRWRGRPQDDRRALIAAFLAKSIYNLATTRQLISRLKVDAQLRSLCGWTNVAALPSESTFSRSFADFARRKLPEQIHESLVRLTQHGRIIGHIARDSTAIEARETFPETGLQKRNRKRQKAGKPPVERRRGKHYGITAKQRTMKLSEMLKGISRDCGIGTKTSSKGHHYHWRGYKLHLDVADGQIPITAMLTSAHVHDSKAAIPMMTITSQRVCYLYDLMDSAYDANAILEHSRELGHVPVVEPNGRRGRLKPRRGKPIRPKPELCPAKAERYRHRTMVERVNARLKDEFGGRTVRVRGSDKVMAHLMFGVIALTVDQILKLIT